MPLENDSVWLLMMGEKERKETEKPGELEGRKREGERHPQDLLRAV